MRALTFYSCAVSIMLTALLALPCQARVLEGRVIGISDGDTLTLRAGQNNYKIRLAQIDAPEKKQAYGQRSKVSLSELAFGQNVIADIETKDKYGRLVATIWAQEINVNLEQVRRGMAWVYVQYAHSADMLDAQRTARSAKRGLWADRKAIAPWDWRQSQRVPTDGLPSLTRDLLNPTTRSPSAAQSAKFRCGSKQSCLQMTSCEEARFYLQQCGQVRLDRNADGVPCEALCH